MEKERRFLKTTTLGAASAAKAIPCYQISIKQVVRIAIPKSDNLRNSGIRGACVLKRARK